ncbi:signal transduction histidine kinase [Mesorhizobium sp. YL-MeA3-2017]|uniref:sensor histidine kinase n=1 Tax=Mesorhizobium sp. YL-MeA3-2017 TaxID=3042284 RepID=UPI0015C761C9|nr:sensor histidine kinase [Mesorhizobium sp. YL-MeA3-2017]MDQ0333049.1 signal transduction histidine kinase [Mesorhizobium sp. YL-MeA3-2017]
MFKISARTVLELGAELISSDIIAFYELIKNAIDARSRKGVELAFGIALRRNSYLKIRARAIQATNAVLSELQTDLENLLDPTSGNARAAFDRALASQSIEDFIANLDDGYARANTIIVADTGDGMSMGDLTRYYLTIGTPSRKHKVDSSIASGHTITPYLGEKGIGRLSAMRLGERLRVETAKSGDRTINVLDIDWRAFADLDAMIEDVKFEPEPGGPKPDTEWSGTRLTIGDLREDWTEARLERLAKYDFARLTDPFLDPKKRPRIVLSWNGTRIPIDFMDKTLLDAAHASFTGRYEIKDGRPELFVRMDATNLGYTHPRESDVVTLTEPDLEGLLSGTSGEIPSSALVSVGPFNFEGYWYNRRHFTAIDGIGNRNEVRDLQKNWSGILLFRDGFRVFPYGDEEDDWLGLDRRALGRTGYILNKNQFVGHVQITRAGNPHLLDQTNREGLRVNPEQTAFVQILGHVVKDLLWGFFKDVDRRHKRTPIELGDMKSQIEQLKSRASGAIARVRRLVPKEEQEVVDDLQHALVEFQDLTARAQKRIEEVEADGKQMIQMAGVGLMVEVVAHELARATEGALQALEALKGRDLPSEIRARLETLRSEMKSVSKRLRVLDQLSVSGRQRSEVFDLAELFDDIQEGHVAQFKRHNVVLKIKKPKSPVRVRLVKGMVIQIIENLLSNSLYWIQMRQNREPRIVPTITVTIESDPPTITFEDNGSGIAHDHIDKIFRPFWSLKEKSKRRGLGLYIAKENAEHLGGTLVISNKQDPQTQRHSEFVLELPESALAQ